MRGVDGRDGWYRLSCPLECDARRIAMMEVEPAESRQDRERDSRRPAAGPKADYSYGLPGGKAPGTFLLADLLGEAVSRIARAADRDRHTSCATGLRRGIGRDMAG